MGAGGDFIYLAFRRRNDYTDKLLTGMKVGNDNLWMYTMGTDANYNLYFIGLKQHNSDNLQDLNEDAGGSYIYLYYTNRFVDESNLPGKK